MIFFSKDFRDDDWGLPKILVLLIVVVCIGLGIIWLLCHIQDENTHLIVDIYSDNDNGVVAETIHTTADKVSHDPWSVTIDNVVYNCKYVIRKDPDFTN